MHNALSFAGQNAGSPRRHYDIWLPGEMYGVQRWPVRLPGAEEFIHQVLPSVSLHYRIAN
jgi:hypothetical protein